MFGNHLEEVRGLMEIYRYQGKIMNCRRSVAEHSWFVAKVAHGLALWEKHKFGNKDIDIEKVLFLAINHDIVEAYTGDILSTTKSMSEKLRSGLKAVEETCFKENILTTIPKSWGKPYMEVHDEMGTLSSIEAQLVKAGDLFDRVFECMEEIDRGNKKPFEQIIIGDLMRLSEMDLMSVNYFLRYSIRDIGADRYISEETNYELEGIDFSPYF